VSTPQTRTSSTLSALDALVLAVLLAVACAPFVDAIRHPDRIPAGMDLTQHYSREAVIRQALHTTWIPLWNPYEFSGFPLQADLQTGVFYPPSVALRLLALAPFLTWTVILHIWLFGVGSYVLCRTVGVGRAASTIAAVGLMLGGITVPRVYAGHLDVLRTLAWVPLVIALGIRSIERRTLLPSVPLVVALALELLSGFLQLVCYTVLVIALYAVCDAVSDAVWPSGRPSPRGLYTAAAQLVLVVVIVLGLTAFQLLPSARLVMAAGRTQGISLHSAVESSVELSDLPRTMLWPATTGDIEKQSWETAAYVGWPLMVLAPFALFVTAQRRQVLFFVVLGVTSLALATGEPLYALHHAIFPMFRIPGRLMCFWALSIGVLGALALDSFAERLTGRAKGRNASAPRSRQVAAALLFVVVGSVVSWSVYRYARHFTSFERLDDRFATALPFAPTRFGRVLSVCENRLHTSEITALGVPSVDGYNSYFLLDYARLAEQERGEEPGSQRTSFPRMGESGRIVDPGVLDLLNVTEILSCASLNEPGFELIGQPDGFYVYRNHRAMGRINPICEGPGKRLAFGVPGCADGVDMEMLSADDPRGLVTARVSLPAQRVLVFSESYYPERRAWVDGVETPIEKVSVALSAIHVGPGSHRIELRLVPTSLYYGALISSITLVLWLTVRRIWCRVIQKALPVVV
jgi:hypothetical protein